jgi:heat shock transcription factor
MKKPASFEDFETFQTSSRSKTIPAFLNKLYSMVNDPSTDELIHWSLDGLSFVVKNQVSFAKQVLPRFFKHNNFASFVRQLNMYGFHKVPHLQDGALVSEGEDSLEFSNPNFQRDQPDLLAFVSRKKGPNHPSHPNLIEEPKEIFSQPSTVDLSHIVDQITTIRRHQATIKSDLKNIETDNRALWAESTQLRERYAKQQHTIDKIVSFLASVFSSTKSVSNTPKRGLFLEEIDDRDNSKKQKKGKFWHNLT